MHFGIRFKLTIIFVLFSALVLSGVGFLAYNSGRAALRTSVTSELLSTAIEKQTALDTWIDERKNDVDVLARSPDIIREVGALISAQSGSAGFQAAHDDLREHLLVRANSGNVFLELMVMEPANAQVLVSTNTIEEGTFKENLAYFIYGKNGPFVQNLYFSPALNTLAITVSAPIRRADGRLLGVLAGRLPLAEMSALISQRTGTHQTDEAFLVDASSLFATQPRLMSDPAVMRRGVHTAAVENCLQRTSGVILSDDYRGVPALVAYRWLPERQLCLIVKLDQAEAFAPTQEFGHTILLVGILILLASAGLAYGVSNSITRPVRQLVQGTEQIRQGNLNVHLQMPARDEIGVLGAEFNQMAAAIAEKEGQLRQWAAELENRVQERTAALSASETRYRSLFENMLGGYAYCQMVYENGQPVDYTYLDVNAEFEILTGLKQVVGKKVSEVIPGVQKSNPELFERFGRVAETGQPEKIEVYVPGLVMWFSIAVYSTEKETFVAIFENITARKQAEETLRMQSEELKRSNAELERFAYVASHDLQEPLRMVISYMQLLERRYNDQLDGDAREFIAYAVDGSNRMKALINDLLAYSRVGTRGKEFQSTQGETILRNVLSNLKIAIEENQAEISHDPLPEIMADGVQLEQVFQNLIGNALKFRGDTPPRIHIGLELKDHTWIFSVQDNGIGIDPQYFERIFIIFQRLHTRSKYEGTGIGLAVTKRIVERHGGRIWVESQPGAGSTFYFSIPSSGDKQA